MMLSNEMLTFLAAGAGAILFIARMARNLVTKDDLKEFRKELEPLLDLPERVAALEAKFRVYRKPTKK